MEDLKEIIDYAISQEEFWYNTYMDAVKKTDVESVKTLLKSLADQEKVHKQRLHKLKVGELQKKIIPGKLKEIDITGEMMQTPLAEMWNVQETLKFAIDAEQTAHNMYEKMSRSTDDKEAIEMFNMLAAEESKHKALLQKAMKEIEV